VEAVIPVREIDGRIEALMLLIGLFLWNFIFTFGSVFKVINLE
jgi:hypothetical protein